MSYISDYKGTEIDESVEKYLEVKADGGYVSANELTTILGDYDTSSQIANIYLTQSSAAATYAPLTGIGTSGTWPISISGNASTATSATSATKDSSGNTITSKYMTIDTDQTNITGSKRFTKAVQCYRYTTNNNLPAITMDKPGSNYVGIGSDGTANRIKFGPCSDLAGSAWVATSSFNSNEWYFQGSITCTSSISVSSQVYAPDFGTDGGMTVHPSNSNEVNFGGSNNSGTIYFGYRAWGSKPIPSVYVFSGSGGTAQVKCGSLTQTSSYNYKHDISFLDEYGDIIDQLKPVSFIYNSDTQNKKRFGLIFEDTINILPEICYDDGPKLKSINYVDLISILLKEIQSLRKRVKQLEDKQCHT